jgi:hypothetical protein
MSQLIFWSHFAATFYMCGLVAFVHGVHYPMFANIPKDAFAAYEAIHLKRSGAVIVPYMLLEAATGLVLIFSMPEILVAPNFFFASLAALAVVWLVTFTWSVPMHARLEGGFDPKAHASLMRSNLVRVLFWALRGVLLIFSVLSA